MLAGEIARRAPGGELADDTIVLRLHGAGGQSFGAWAPRGLTLELVGPCNDYAGKGLSGGRLVVRPPVDAGYVAEDNVVVGNTVLYGATAGEAFFRGRAGERFCVRNSGATAVVEGLGDHGCEYMTGGVVVVLGPTGRNLAAGMSGGVAFVLAVDGPEALAARTNLEMVDLEAVEDDEDVALLTGLLARHAELTGSAVAERLVREGRASAARFRKVMPKDLRRVLEAARQDQQLAETTPVPLAVAGD
jgi:glutamate synthase domain-containing protein 3